MTEPAYDGMGVSYKAKWIEAEMIINAIGSALEGEEPSDFELSYPIVRKAWDIWNILKSLEGAERPE